MFLWGPARGFCVVIFVTNFMYFSLTSTFSQTVKAGDKSVERKPCAHSETSESEQPEEKQNYGNRAGRIKTYNNMMLIVNLVLVGNNA